MTNPRKNAGTTRGKPFAHGNPGRPRGSRHKATLAAEALLEGEAEALTRAAIQKAKERLVPPRKDRPIVFDLGKLDGPADALDALRAVLAAMSRGDITPSEAEAVAALLESLRRAHETTELEARIAALEAKHDSGP